MPRRRRTLPISSPESAEPHLDISDADWQRLESKLGKQLLGDVRKDVHEATQRFLSFEGAERTAEPLKDAQKIIEACRKGASNFQQALVDQASKSSDASVYARRLIRQHFNDPDLSDANKLFRVLGNLVTGFNVACTKALAQLDDPSIRSFRPGRAWGRWIRRLTEIMCSNNLPHGVSKDEVSRSQFTDFVWELQRLVPAECRRHMHSDGALRKAILEARTRPTRQAEAEASAAEGTDKPRAETE